MDEILKYFKNLSPEQIRQFEELGILYPDWNAKINVISRKDIGNLYTNHVLHSLGIAKFTDFKDGSYVLDLGTGGGFPGIPLAILFPETNFLLIDRIGKKINVAKDIADRIGLKNVDFRHCDIAEVKEKFDFVVSRAVMQLDSLVTSVRNKIKPSCINSIPNGLICLKGGELNEELSKIRQEKIITNLSEYFEEEYFSTKKIIYIPLP
ncbi:MAG TPA: 16S rRNA (guanine(527)-N(7))-methyltransferase RsmG [Candidatus Limisoma gallistercoris]|nr:16S rRNA (guanine(527)-N(7))-methyltransferase RsmG [Candidatus Limisoma gallistercoris]